MSRPPPTPTLFPYTTLFRSHPQPLVGLRHQHWQAAAEKGEAGHVSADRKSTRLNSSHVAISYAVCCLKKKNAVGLLWRRCVARGDRGRNGGVRQCRATRSRR